MIKLSVVIITLNEEKQIGRCIDSIREVADEMLIIDSFSTDKTQEIAKTKGVKFIRHEFKGHIQQKNWGLEKARYHHVLSLDADEALDLIALSEIRKIKEEWTHDSYTFNRLTNYCGQWIKHCGWYPDRKIRLVDRRRARWGGLNPHDKIKLAKGASNKLLKGNILHYSFPTVSSHAATANNFSEIAAKTAVENGKTIIFPVHVVLNPLFTFIKKYIFQFGFMDGFLGLTICVLSAYANFLKYAKIWQLKRGSANLQN